MEKTIRRIKKKKIQLLRPIVPCIYLKRGSQYIQKTRPASNE